MGQFLVTASNNYNSWSYNLQWRPPENRRVTFINYVTYIKVTFKIRHQSNQPLLEPVNGTFSTKNTYIRT